MTVVVKLGSSIVADERGEVRGGVLDGVCAQVAELHHEGEDVAMVTSGAIALGWRLMELPQRPRTVDELQAASAIGQGTLFRAYESRLGEPRRARGAGAAHVLRPVGADALPQRAPGAAPDARLARRPGGERERHHGDRRDHLRRQRLPLGAAGAVAGRADAGPAHRHARAAHGGSAARPRGDAGGAGRRTSPSSRATRSAIGARCTGRAGCGARCRPPGWRAPPGSRP